jgi:6-phosphogluconolactonase (cycloisomerase 2 family)
MQCNIIISNTFATYVQKIHLCLFCRLVIFILVFHLDSRLIHGSEFVYVSNFGNNSISRFDTNGIFIDSINTNIFQPEGMAIDSNQNLFVSNFRVGNLGGRSISQFNSNGTFNRYIVSNLNLYLPTALSFDNAGILSVANYGDDTISKFDVNGNFLDKVGASYVSAPSGIVHDSSGYMYVSNANPISGNYVISKFDQSGKFISYLGSNLNAPSGITIDSKGDIIVANSGNNTIVRLDTAGNYKALVTAKVDTPWGIAVDPFDQLYVVNTGNSTISKFDSAGYQLLTITSNLNNPQYIVVGIPEPSNLILSIIALLLTIHTRFHKILFNRP